VAGKPCEVGVMGMPLAKQTLADLEKNCRPPRQCSAQELEDRDGLRQAVRRAAEQANAVEPFTVVERTAAEMAGGGAVLKILGAGAGVVFDAYGGIRATGSALTEIAEGRIGTFAANEIRLSQNSVSFNKIDRVTGQSYTYDDLVASMRLNGWKGDPVDVVRMPDSKLTSMDNTRITAAREAGIDVRATVRSFDEPLTPEIQKARGWNNYSTWGEAITGRINNQSKSFGAGNPYGSFQSPRIKGKP
jgi:hypothetical protein